LPAALILGHAELVEQPLLGMQEAHREQPEVGVPLARGPGHRLEVLGLRVVQLRHATPTTGFAGGARPAEVRRGDRVVLLGELHRHALGHRVGLAVLQRPQRPRRAVVRAMVRRAVEDLDLRH
jgi:hypothetical protein